MVNKKGWLKVFEATIAAMVVISMLFFISVKGSSGADLDLENKVIPVLERIASNESFRNNLTLGGEANPAPLRYINQSFLFLSEEGLEYSVAICNYSSSCLVELDKSKQVNSYERVVISSLNKTHPLKIRVFIWIKY